MANDVEFTAIYRWLAILSLESLVEWDVLVFLHRHAHILLLPTSEIPKLAGYDTDTTAKALHRLQQMGLARRAEMSASRSSFRPLAPAEELRRYALLQLMEVADSRTVRLALLNRFHHDVAREWNKNGFPVVAFGGSAGALPVLREILGLLPDDTGMAFVVIQHLSPDHKSLLAEILGKRTKMRVVQIKDNMAIEVNQVFVIPPNTDLTIADHTLHLAPRTLDERRRHRSIDSFFNSMAGERTIAGISIVLSGMDSDGIIGTAAVKASGGVTVAQEPETAIHGDLPRHVIADGFVDFIRGPEGIAEILVELSKRLRTGADS